jgi:hypothetical protein
MSAGCQAPWRLPFLPPPAPARLPATHPYLHRPPAPPGPRTRSQDPRKLARIRELLLLEKEVKAAKNPLRNLDGVPDDFEMAEGPEGGDACDGEE